MNTTNTEKPKRTRKTRSDKGVYQLTERDMYVLTYIADQYAMRFDQVRQLLSDDPQGKTKAELLAVPTVQTKINKWVKAGWAKYRRWLADGPGWVWVTKAGLAALELDGYLAKPPAVTRLAHIYAVNEVRYQIDYHLWTSERAVRAELEEGDKHPIPDAVIEDEEGIETAIEVEISIKKPLDLVEKMKRLLPHYDLIHFYVPDEKVLRAVMNAHNKLTEKQQQRISFFLIDLSGMPQTLDD